MKHVRRPAARRPKLAQQGGLFGVPTEPVAAKPKEYRTTGKPYYSTGRFVETGQGTGFVVESEAGDRAYGLRKYVVQILATQEKRGYSEGQLTLTEFVASELDAVMRLRYPVVAPNAGSLKEQVYGQAPAFYGSVLLVGLGRFSISENNCKRVKFVDCWPSERGFILNCFMLDEKSTAYQEVGSGSFHLLLKGKRIPMFLPDGREGEIILEATPAVAAAPAPAPEPAPASTEAERKKKLKLRLAAARLRLAAAAALAMGEKPAEVAVRPQIDYSMRHKPEVWDIPAAWGAKMPAQHFAFLNEINARQRVAVGNVPKQGWQPVKVAASEYGIRETRVVRELLELSTVHLVRTTLAPLRNNPGADFKPFLDRLVALYQNQFSLLDLRTATTIINQQYSTPGPLSAILGEWIARKHPQLLAGSYDGLTTAPGTPYVLEPTAGNGLLAARFDPKIVGVNEIEETRLAQLRLQGFGRVTNYDAVTPPGGALGSLKYFGVIANPPFGTTGTQHIRHWQARKSYSMTGWEHLIAVHALNQMHANGRASIIVGGHHKFDATGRLFGRDWAFFNYLYQHFADVRVFQLDSQKLYSRQGTTWPIRVILLDGCGQTGNGLAPRHKGPEPLPQITSFHELAYQMGLISLSEAA